jgi:hypothetical protein
MASFTSILSDIGNAFKKIFSVGVAVATAAEPFVDTLFPGVSALFNAVAAEAAKIEASAVAAGAQSGTGAQKLAAVTAAVEGAFNTYAQQNGLALPSTTVVENAVNGVVAFLNALPAVTTAAKS